MQYLLGIIITLAFVAVQLLLIILKVTNQFTVGWGLILMPTWFACAVVVVILIAWALVAFLG
jgi:hypothetical protein